MATNPKKYSQRRITNFNFLVEIYSLDGSILQLDLPVDKVDGLNTGKTDIIWHRDHGYSSSHKVPFPGLSQSSTLTLEGSTLFNLKDLTTLKEWHDQVTQAVPTDLGGYRKQITVQMTKFDERGQAVVTETVGGKWVVENCVITKLSSSALDPNSAGYLTWSAEIEFHKISKIGV